MSNEKDFICVSLSLLYVSKKEGENIDGIKIKDLSILEKDWNCPEIIDREFQRGILNDIISRLKRGEKPRCAFVYGKAGTGKTFVIKKLLENDVIHIEKVRYKYVNLKEFGVPSSVSTLIDVLNSLSDLLPVNALGKTWNEIPLRGWDTYIYVSLLKEILKQRNIHLVLVLDEIDRLFNYEKNDDFIYMLLNEENITPIFISNDIKLLDKLESRTKDRISCTIYFNDYSIGDLINILRQHIKYAIEGDIDDGILEKIAKFVWEGSKSARDAKMLLANYLKHNNFDVAIRETEKNTLKQEMYNMNTHQYLILRAIVERNLDIDRMLRRGDFYTDVYPTAGSIYNKYLSICKEVGINPKSYKTFQRVIVSLELSALIRRVINSLGRSRGVTTLIYPGEDINFMKEILDELKTNYQMM